MLNIKELQNLAAVIKIAEVCRRGGLSYPSIAAKISRGSELTITESEKISAVLKAILKNL